MNNVVIRPTLMILYDLAYNTGNMKYPLIAHNSIRYNGGDSHESAL